MNLVLEDSQTLTSVVAPLTFAKRDGATPVSLPSRPGEGEGRYEGDHEQHAVEITNAWPLADELSLDREGFQVVHHHTDLDIFDEADRTDAYEREIETLIKQATGARHVIVFDHTLRTGDEKSARREETARTGADGAQRLHRPFRPAASARPRRQRRGGKLMQGRFAIMNVWRGIDQTVESHPLAFAEARSIDPAT